MRELTVSATGVVRIDAGRESEIRVNDENLIGMIERMIADAHPKTDYHDQFAGRVTITVELLGDLKEQQEADP